MKQDNKNDVISMRCVSRGNTRSNSDVSNASAYPHRANSARLSGILLYGSSGKNGVLY